MTIPARWIDPVRAALHSAFAVDRPDQVHLLRGGLSGVAVLRIVVQGRSYVMRLDPPGAGMSAPQRWHPCLRIAADAGVAPKVHHLDDHGISIVDFIAQEPARPYWMGDRAQLLVDLGELLRRLHTAQAFPPLEDYLSRLSRQAQEVAGSGLLSASELAEPTQLFRTLQAVYRKLDPQLVPSHNDINPYNLLHDGKRLWLVDWVSAFQADRYVDLAATASFFVQDDESETLFLTAYFGTPPSGAMRARFYLARQLSHLFFAVAILPTAGGQRPARQRSLDALHLALSEGEALFDTAPGRAEYALARLAAMIAGILDPRFETACLLAT